MRFIRFMLVATIILTLTGCANTGHIASLPSETKAAHYTQPNTALVTLLNHAQQAQADNDLEAADGLLMRALRISPTAPEVYYRMALLRKAQRQPEQARQLASRALSLNPNQTMKQDLNTLLLQL
ncbi:tetratricopeptide repeat protein [Endozoicomonas sp.]|nr:tetratricopeptide repeat protein [Endozoicomonas sp.]